MQVGYRLEHKYIGFNMATRLKRINGCGKWILVFLAFCGILWNAATLHFGVKQNTAVLQNDMAHLKGDVTEIKTDIKSINTYLLERSNK